jgi:WD40 repeat protein
VRGVAFAFDGRLVSAGEDGCVGLWNPADLASLGVIQALAGAEESWPEGIQSLAILDERNALAGDANGRLLQVDLAPGTVTVLGASGDWPLTALSISGDRRVAVSGSAGGAVERWALGGHEASPELLGNVSEARSVVLTPDGSRAIVGDLDGVISSFASGNTEPNSQLRGHVNYVDALATADGGRLLLSGGWDRTLRLWDLAAEQELGRYTWEVPIARADAATRDGCYVVAVGDRQGSVFFLSIERPGH